MIHRNIFSLVSPAKKSGGDTHTSLINISRPHLRVAKCNISSPWYKPLVSAIKLSSLVERSMGPVLQRLKRQLWICKNPSTCSRLSAARGARSGCWPPPQRCGVSFHQSNARGQEALTKSGRSSAVSAGACPRVHGEMSFCEVIRFQFPTQPYRSPFTSWASNKQPL